MVFILIITYLFYYVNHIPTYAKNNAKNTQKERSKTNKKTYKNGEMKNNNTLTVVNSGPRFVWLCRHSGRLTKTLNNKKDARWQFRPMPTLYPYSGVYHFWPVANVYKRFGPGPSRKSDSNIAPIPPLIYFYKSHNYEI